MWASRSASKRDPCVCVCVNSTQCNETQAQHGTQTFFPDLGRDVVDVEVLDVQLPQIGQLAELYGQLLNASVAAEREKQGKDIQAISSCNCGKRRSVLSISIPLSERPTVHDLRNMPTLIKGTDEV